MSLWSIVVMANRPDSLRTLAARCPATSAVGAEWMVEGRSRDRCLELFFSNEAVEIASAICRRCAVRQVCVEHAFAHHFEHGLRSGSFEHKL